MNKGAKAREKNRKLWIASISLIMTLAITLSLGQVKGQTGGPIVANDPPSWIDLYVDDINGITQVHIALRDLNGWDDIYNVTIMVFDGHGSVICNITYSQYPSLDSETPAISWDEKVGGYLNRTESYWSPVDIWPWVPPASTDMIGLNVTFGLHSFSGDIIRVIAYDKAETKCEYLGPFSSDYEIPSYFPPGYKYPISISTIVALIGAGILTIRRYYSNKLAMSIAATMKKNGNGE